MQVSVEVRPRVSTPVLAVGAAIAVFGIAIAPFGIAQEDEYHYGLVEYEIACLPCHGVDGRGDGPLSAYLTTPAADLTQIAKSNGGVFPALEVFEIIDGRATVAAHGKREMPVWGDRYRIESADDESRAAIETEALARIAALVRYIEALQDR